MAEAKNRLCSKKKNKSKGHTANVKAERRRSKGKAQQTNRETHESNTNNARNKHTKAAEGDSIGDPDDTRKRQRQRMTEETMGGRRKPRSVLTQQRSSHAIPTGHGRSS